MARPQSKGKCPFCERAFTGPGMGRHLGPCRNKHSGKDVSGPRKLFYHIAVQGRYLPEYWMHLEVRASATLDDLDGFLRNTWLECCGHLSAFRIAGVEYLPSDYDSPDGESMDVRLDEVLEPGLSFLHEYDFGTTTVLSLKVVSQWERTPTVAAVTVLARNDAPVIACQTCGKAATQLCTQCIYEGKGWLCDKCVEEHECDEDMLLPVVNSPRVGMCGYTG